MEEQCHRHCSLGLDASGQYVVHRLTSEVCRLPLEEGPWSLTWDATGQGILEHCVAGAPAKQWLSERLRFALVADQGRCYVWDKVADIVELFGSFMSKHSSHLFPFSGHVEGGHSYILGWALEHAHSGSKVFISLKHWCRAMGLPGQPHLWYLKNWHRWLGWLKTWGLGPEHLKKASGTEQAKAELEDSWQLPLRVWSNPAVSMVAFACLLARWAAASKGRVDKCEVTRSAAASFLGSVTGSMGSYYKIELYTAGFHLQGATTIVFACFVVALLVAISFA